MGVSCSCPFSVHHDLENGFESVILKSIGLEDDKPISLKDKDSETRVSSRPSDFGEPLVGASVRLRARKCPNMMGLPEVATQDKCLFHEIMMSPVPTSDASILNHSSCPQHAAAIKLQKVYKSFRTRRKLADCAVLVEQTWWKLLDFAELKHSSISFFDLDKNETAISRWSRARTRAAKVGKGLSKNSKAQKLALQHWLEAIDPRHRYGHNLHFYYVKWLNSQSKEPFFYWLDIGEGKEVNLTEKCPRSKLQQQCIKYLGLVERNAYEVVVEGGKLLYRQTGEFLDTSGEPEGSKWIFVLSTSRSLYVGKKKKGSFQHSSFLAGGATLAAGRILAEKGVLKAVWPHSGHYRPTPENFQNLLLFLQDNNVDLTGVELDSTEEEGGGSICKKNSSMHFRCNSSEDDLAGKDQFSSNETNLTEEEKFASVWLSESGQSHDFTRKPTALKIPSNKNLLHKLMHESQMGDSSADGCCPLESQVDIDGEAEESETILEDSIFHRINSPKDIQSYRLVKQLSCQWSNGAGPRIGCLRDYPSGLQTHALEQVNLSPRSEQNQLRIGSLPRRTSSTPISSSNLCRGASRLSPSELSTVKSLTCSQ